MFEGSVMVHVVETVGVLMFEGSVMVHVIMFDACGD